MDNLEIALELGRYGLNRGEVSPETRFAALSRLGDEVRMLLDENARLRNEHMYARFVLVVSALQPASREDRDIIAEALRSGMLGINFLPAGKYSVVIFGRSVNVPATMEELRRLLGSDTVANSHNEEKRSP